MEIPNIRTFLEFMYLHPTYSRKKAEKSWEDNLSYAERIPDQVVGGIGSASLFNMFLSMSFVSLVNHSSNPSFIKESDYIMDNPFIPALIGSIGVSLLTNTASGLYESYRNRQNRNMAKRGERVLKNLEIEDYIPNQNF